ncbi:MreB/Mrl family cell shape determining protein [bacterium]|nr:MreB/Mrl family cell shape determining protein [bacterium]
MFHQIRRWACPDLAIDLGTANTQVAVPGAGVVLDEPTVVALQKGSRRVLGQGTAVGKLARQMLGRTPDSITTARPVQDGVITDFELCEAMLRYFLRKIGRRKLGLRHRVVMPVPGSITPVERRALRMSAERAGAGHVYLMADCKAAAIGAGLPISEPLASLVCDIGGGTTEIAVLSLGEIVSSRSLRIAGDEMDEAIVESVRRNYSLRIGTQSAEQLKMRIGCAAPRDQELTAELRGLDLVSGVPRKAIITSEELREALAEPLEIILRHLQTVIEHCDPELVSDLADTGMVLCGGGAMLPGIDVFFQERLGIPVRVPHEPQRMTVRGAAICAEHLDRWRDALEDEFRDG